MKFYFRGFFLHFLSIVLLVLASNTLAAEENTVVIEYVRQDTIDLGKESISYLVFNVFNYTKSTIRFRADREEIRAVEVFIPSDFSYFLHFDGSLWKNEMVNDSSSDFIVMNPGTKAVLFVPAFPVEKVKELGFQLVVKIGDYRSDPFVLAPENGAKSE